MPDYDPTNTGAIFRNDKGDNPKRPDYRGELNVAGALFKLSGWIKEAKGGKMKGEKYISVRIEAQVKAKEPSKPAATPPAEAFDSDVPF